MDKKLTRDTSDKMVAGVASGLANYFQLDVTWVRIAFALAAFFGGGGLWVYIILWIAVPEENEGPFQVTDYKVKSEEPNNFGSTFKPKDKINLNLIGGLVLIGLGSYFLLDEFGIIPYWFHVGKLWPLVFVVQSKNLNQKIWMLQILKRKQKRAKNNTIKTMKFNNYESR
jgi:phage shock protein C